jgi:hypothetical protein
MTTESAKTDQGISSLDSGQESEPSPEPAKEGEYLRKRPPRRRMRLRSLTATARASDQVISDEEDGLIDSRRADIRSRMLVRHQTILSALKQDERMAVIQAGIERIQGGSPPAWDYGNPSDTPALDYGESLPSNGHDPELP